MKKILMAAALAGAFVAGPAAAQMYLGAGVGQAKTDKHDDSMKIYGGYQFTPTWGLEVAYTDLGSYRGADIESWSVAGTGTMPLGNNWALFGKLGASANHPSFPGSSDRTDLLAGLGIAYTFNRNLSARLEYENFGKLSDSNNGNNDKGKNLGLSLRYGF